MGVILASSRADRKRSTWWSHLRHLSHYQKQYWLPFAVAVMLLGSILVFDVGMGVVQQSFFAQMKPGHLSALLHLVWVCGAVGVGLAVLQAVQHFCRYYADAYANRALALDMLQKVNRLPFGLLQKFHSADLVSRVVNDSGIAGGLLSSLVYDVLYQVLLGGVAMVYLMRINVTTAIVATMVGPVLFGLGRFFDGRIRKISEQIQAQDASIRAKVQESIQEMAAIRAYGLEDRTAQAFQSGKVQQNRLVLRRSVMQSAMWQLVLLAQGGVQVVSAVLVARNALSGLVSPGQVMTFVFLMGNVQVPFMRMSQVWNGIQQSLGAADRLDTVRRLPDEAARRSDGAQMAAVASAEGWAIEIQDVHLTPGRDSDDVTVEEFASNTNASEPLFTGLNLRVRRGETVALVGPSGSGKTSLARLICGLYHPDRGDVRVFGHSIHTEIAEARRGIAYVPQSPYLFSGTVRENIAFGLEQPSDEEIMEAAKAAAVHDFIVGLDQGYDTIVGEQGYRLSGGQRQRIAIARAFLRNAPLVVLDEPTSALDNETERAIQLALQRLAVGRTMVVIAHRLSTIRDADRIIVLQRGGIVEEGTHDALVNEDGEYAKLIAMQTT